VWRDIEFLLPQFAIAFSLRERLLKETEEISGGDSVKGAGSLQRGSRSLVKKEKAGEAPEGEGKLWGILRAVRSILGRWARF